jgi:hypothetical protein
MSFSLRDSSLELTALHWRMLVPGLTVGPRYLLSIE